MGREAKFRKDLSMPGMVAEMRRCFDRIEDAVSSRGLTLSDCLMSGLAIFALKYPSLLRFDRDARRVGEPSAREGNLRQPVRDRSGAVGQPDAGAAGRAGSGGAASSVKRLFALAQRGGVLKEYEWLGGRHVLSVGRHGALLVATVHCGNCCVKNRRDGGVEYYTSRCARCWCIRSAARWCRWLPPEPILKTDGARKNDCERNAAKRLLTALRREHPHLPLLVVEDGLASNGPHVRLLKESGHELRAGREAGRPQGAVRVGGRVGVGTGCARVEAGRGALGDDGRGRR